MPLTITIDARRVLAHIETLPRRLQQRLVARLQPVRDAMLGPVRAAEPRRTGQLQRQTLGFVDAGTDRSGHDRVVARVRVLGRDRSVYGKAGALEYGAHGMAHVSAYERASNEISFAFWRPHGELVAAYDRHVHIAERRFLRGAEDSVQDAGRQAIEQAIADAAQE